MEGDQSPRDGFGSNDRLTTSLEIETPPDFLLSVDLDSFCFRALRRDRGRDMGQRRHGFRVPSARTFLPGCDESGLPTS